VKVWKQFERPPVPSFEARRQVRIAGRRARRKHRERWAERMAASRADRTTWRERLARERALRGDRPRSISATAERWRARSNDRTRPRR
jgi:hypothetical protein